jgi:hypothetical protein
VTERGRPRDWRDTPRRSWTLSDRLLTVPGSGEVDITITVNLRVRPEKDG